MFWVKLRIKEVTLFPTVYLGCSRMLRIIIIIIGLLVFQHPVNADDSISKNLSYFESPFFKALHPNAKSGTKKIEVRFGSDIYAIPENYLRDLNKPTQTGDYAGFMLEVLLPNMEPKSNNNIVKFHQLGAPDILLATVEFGRQDDAPELVIDRIISGHSNNFLDTAQGYRLYHTGFQGDLYIHRLKDGQIFYFLCDTNEHILWPRCEVLENLSSSITIQYYFYNKYINSAIDIDQKLRELIFSFKSKN